MLPGPIGKTGTVVAVGLGVSVGGAKVGVMVGVSVGAGVSVGSGVELSVGVDDGAVGDSVCANNGSAHKQITSTKMRLIRFAISTPPLVYRPCYHR